MISGFITVLKQRRKRLSSDFWGTRTKRTRIPNLCLSDFIAPELSGIKIISGHCCHGRIHEEALKRYKGDDYSIIMIRYLGIELLKQQQNWFMKRSVRNTGVMLLMRIFQQMNYLSQNIGGSDRLRLPACPDHTEKQLFSNCLKLRKE